MAQTNINIRIDENLKKDFDAVCNDLGLTMTTAFNVFAKTVTRRKAIPFEITAEEDPFYSEANQKRLLRAIADYEAGRNFHEHELIEAD
jgi:DNA-damage-inducible protein J